MENINVYLLGLGCAKNMVDSELMSGVLRRNGYRIVSNEWDADISSSIPAALSKMPRKRASLPSCAWRNARKKAAASC